ncbi:antibiotic biosynthesis monooxygenase [Aestuariicella hydrocarbonica]|uniref:Antibiotic biosynthesis monooxygenase n=1 Tax=Pseudomaricurvus hydrocarbonicus TaxID=1470433 RepID=A0A9E5MPT1_9GAMM|nr:antibiotic biosynthesis monooxygenase family protein [Aestuariicella hydrocarbonica]NHO68259.1 antibiotic biosynthesis monooxygenase [Aestuariicella hydrocarbonica]
MSFKLLVTFNVLEEKTDLFFNIMLGAKSSIEDAEGCQGVEILQSKENPSKVILAEVWQSEAQHDSYAEKMKEVGSMESLAAFLVEPPQMEMFTIG